MKDALTPGKAEGQLLYRISFSGIKIRVMGGSAYSRRCEYFRF